MVTTRHSNQQGSKSRQNPCQVQPPENIGNLSASRPCLWVRTIVSTVFAGVLPVFQNLNYKLQRRLSDVHPTKSSKTIQKMFYISGVTRRRQVNCAILYKEWHRPIVDVKTVHQTSLLYTESNPDRLGLLSPTHGQRSQQKCVQITLQSVLINKPKFLKATRHEEMRKIVILRSVTMEALSW